MCGKYTTFLALFLSFGQAIKDHASFSERRDLDCWNFIHEEGQLILAVAAFVKLTPSGGDGGQEAGGYDLLLEQGAVLQPHIHEVRVHGGAAADGGIRGVIEGLDVLLKRGAQQVDVFDHPVVGDGFPNVVLFRFGLKTVGELAQVHIVDGLGPAGDHRGAKGGQRLLPEFGMERLMDEGGRQVDAGVGWVVGFARIDLDEEIVVALLDGEAVPGVDGRDEDDVLLCVAPKKDASCPAR